MSTTYQLECDTCKESIWIGQRDYIYTGDAEVMGSLQEFLYRHLSGDSEHQLFFRSDSGSRYMDGADGWTRIKTKGENIETHAEVEHKPASPPARKHSEQARQAGKTSGLASKLDWVAISKDAFDEEPWYDKIIGAGEPTDLEKQRAAALSMFITGVTGILSNCTVYFDFDFRVGSFSAGVLAFFNIGDNWYNANYVTSHISYGLDGDKMTREINNVAHAISTELGQRVFTGAIEPIPGKFLKMVKRVDR